MAKFLGKIGFSATAETVPGVWDEVVTERTYKGNLVKNYKRWEGGESIIDNLNLSNNISVIADKFCEENLSAMKYVKWKGSYWKIASAEIQRPRIILTLGGVYNGPTAEDRTSQPTG